MVRIWLGSLEESASPKTPSSTLDAVSAIVLSPRVFIDRLPDR